jgi:anti-sigma regulatory factor (Ser/Thr protein kinase)
VIVTGQWPAEPSAVPQARRFALDVLAELLPDRAALLELMVSELVTNCVVHARSPFTLRLEASPHEVRVEVSDRAAGSVRPKRPTPHDLHGRGLQIVQKLADSWGVRPSDRGGKTVWFAMNLGV